jgi:hypothetical protein
MHTIITEHLTNILAAITQRHQTGVLSIEYVGEQGIEKGEIYFEGGNTVHARTEEEWGKSALARISHWRRVQCAFFEGVKPLTAFYTPLSHVELAHPGIHAVFQARPAAATAPALSHLERRARMVFMLLDGKRTVQDVARLTNHTESEVARILVRLLKSGYIEYVRG